MCGIGLTAARLVVGVNTSLQWCTDHVPFAPDDITCSLSVYVCSTYVQYVASKVVFQLAYVLWNGGDATDC